MKTKTYILTLSRTFPKGHPREGEETEFAKKVAQRRFAKDGAFPLMKEHTIRANYELWKRRINEVRAGRAVLSVREWLGAPRRSKQRELFRFDRDSWIGVEMLDWTIETKNKLIVRYGCLGEDFGNLRHTAVKKETLAANDGLSLEDWKAWFRDCDRTQPMAIIHFTNFRYVNLKNTRL